MAPAPASEPVVFEVEFRFFVLEREVAAFSPYIRGGEIARNAAGDWAKPRTVFTQFQDVQAGNLDQFREGKAQPIVWPPEFQTGKLIYPYGDARKK